MGSMGNGAHIINGSHGQKAISWDGALGNGAHGRLTFLPIASWMDSYKIHRY